MTQKDLMNYDDTLSVTDSRRWCDIDCQSKMKEKLCQEQSGKLDLTAACVRK